MINQNAKTQAMIFGIFLFIIPPALSWWEYALPAFEATEGESFSNPKISALSRSHKRKHEIPEFSNTGNDLWMIYQVEQNSPNSTRLEATRFSMNSYPEPSQGWLRPQIISSIGSITNYAHSISGYYHSINPFTYVPRAYMTWISTSSTGEKSLFFGHYDEDLILLNGYTIITDNCPVSTHVEWIDEKRTRIIWSEYDPSSLYSIKLKDYNVSFIQFAETDYLYSYELSTSTITVAENIDASQNFPIDPDMHSEFFNISSTECQRKTFICWHENDAITNDSVIKCRMVQSDQNNTVQMSNILTVAEDSGYSLHQRNPKVLRADVTPDSGSVLIAWIMDVVGPYQRIMCQRVSVTYVNNVIVLSCSGQANALKDIPVDSAFCISADNAFCQPQGISYDQPNKRLVYCDRANHRVDWIHELQSPVLQGLPPVPTAISGCWLSEIETDRYAYDSEWRSRLTRIDRTSESYHPVGRQYQIGFIENNSIKHESFNSELLLTRRQDDLTMSGVTIKDLTSASDSYSISYMAYVTDSEQLGSRIYWNADGLWIKEENPGERIPERPNHPYDVSIVPPPIMSPTPAGTAYTPLPTTTPYPACYWVADMAGNRVVRVNYKSEILAETEVALPVPSPTWSAFEGCGVIAPNAVSAAYDGSCWAIDWGRESVVKINSEGTIVARSTPAWDPTPLPTEGAIMHPVALDCGGDPNVCFVADYDGNMVYKLTWTGGGGYQLEKSQAIYFRPFALKVQSGLNDLGQFREYVWVSDHIDLTPTPIPGTWTPHPTLTPAPPPTFTVAPGSPTSTPAPLWTSTPYPMKNRVTRNLFHESDLAPITGSAIPVNLSPVGTIDDYHCWVSDRNSYWIRNSKIVVIEPTGQTWYPSINQPSYPLIQPVDVEGVQP